MGAAGTTKLWGRNGAKGRAASADSSNVRSGAGDVQFDAGGIGFVAGGGGGAARWANRSAVGTGVGIGRGGGSASEGGGVGLVACTPGGGAASRASKEDGAEGGWGCQSPAGCTNAVEGWTNIVSSRSGIGEGAIGGVSMAIAVRVCAARRRARISVGSSTAPGPEPRAIVSSTIQAGRSTGADGWTGGAGGGAASSPAARARACCCAAAIFACSSGGRLSVERATSVASSYFERPSMLIALLR